MISNLSFGGVWTCATTFQGETQLVFNQIDDGREVSYIITNNNCLILYKSENVNPVIYRSLMWELTGCYMNSWELAVFCAAVIQKLEA